MADVPDHLTLRRHRDLEGLYRRGIWVRRVVLTLVAAFCGLGLANRFGQDASTSHVAFPGGELAVSSPTTVRGGDLFGAVFTVTATRSLSQAVLVLESGWAEGLSINTIEPSPTSETSRDGRLAFTLGPIRAGDRFTLYLQFQVDPTYVAWERSQDVTIEDAGAVLARIHRAFTVYP